MDVSSLSAWRAWIEISLFASIAVWMYRRSPLGERGLKFPGRANPLQFRESLSAWRAWIEIVIDVTLQSPAASLSAWRAWIEIATIEIFC